jgi:hypothetical protein
MDEPTLFAAPGDDNGNHRHTSTALKEDEQPSPRRSGPMSTAARLDERTEEGGVTVPCASAAASTWKPIAPAICCVPLHSPADDRDVSGPRHFKVTV